MKITRTARNDPYCHYISNLSATRLIQAKISTSVLTLAEEKILRISRRSNMLFKQIICFDIQKKNN